MRNSVGIALRVFALAFVVLGLAYPLAVTGISRVLIPGKAGGSLVTDARGTVVGSSLIGQRFESAGYFHPRASAGDYDPLVSGGSNLGPTSAELASQLSTRARRAGGGVLPPDAITASGSGLDPHISPANAYSQVERVARARGSSLRQVREMVTEHTVGRDLGFLGEPRVNVLGLNLALDERFGSGAMTERRNRD